MPPNHSLSPVARDNHGVRGKRIFVAIAAIGFLVASVSGASSTEEGRVALARISRPAKPAVPVVLIAPTTTSTSTSTTSSTMLVARPRRAGVVALTFDDGPSAEFTPQVLDILARYNAKATFFLVGSEIEASPDVVRRMVNEGHRIGNHTWDHVALPSLDEAGFVAQVDRTQNLLLQFTRRPATCIRPPFGKTDARVRTAMAARGLSVERWSQDTEDWKHPGVNEIIGNALSGAAPGAVVLLHDSSEQTVAALPAIIEGIHARGLSLAPIC